MNKEKSYDDEPVYYCRRCLSLCIKPVPFSKEQDYCAECGTTDIGCVGIKEWKKMYRKKYGKEFVEKKELKWPYWC